MWSNSIQTIGKKQRLGQLNRMAAMMSTPTRKNAPTAALEIIHDLIPLELALQETALNTYYTLKLVTQSTWTDKKAKKQSLTPHLGFLKRIGDVATGARSDTESILENIRTIGSLSIAKRGRQNQFPPS